MKNLMNSIASAVSGAALFAFGCVMVGLGFAAVSTLALFALAAVGVAMLAYPFVAMAQSPASDTTDPAPAA